MKVDVELEGFRSWVIKTVLAPFSVEFEVYEPALDSDGTKEYFSLDHPEERYDPFDYLTTDLKKAIPYLVARFTAYRQPCFWFGEGDGAEVGIEEKDFTDLIHELFRRAREILGEDKQI